MLDPDISTAQARALLAVPDLDDGPAGPLGWSRRQFLQAIGMGAFSGMAIGTLGEQFFGDLPDAWAAPPIGANDGILVLIVLYGGNDGLNTVIPYSDPAYQASRSNIAIPVESSLPLDGTLALHPELGYVKSLYDAGDVAIVQGVGYPNPDLSHFSSMAIWMNGQFGSSAPTTGWLGRWLDGLPPAASLAGASIDTSVPLHMLGAARRAVAVTPGDLFGTVGTAEDARMFAGIRAMAAASGGRGQWHDAFAATMARQLDVATEVAPAFTGTFPPRGLERDLTVAARLINANIGLRVLDIGRGGFDHHDNEPSKHQDLLRDLNIGIQNFYATLAPEFADRVTMLTVSEFGRTPGSNASLGTDHGTAAPLFVIGQQVKGGLYGAQPSLTALDQNKRMFSTVDFRAVYGTIIDGWLGGGGSTVVNGPFENLGFFEAGPG